MWEKLKVSDEYKTYMSSDIDSFARDQELVINIFKTFIADDEAFEQFLEEKICIGLVI